MQPNRIISGNVLDVLPALPDESIHCVVTSPPYWSLRDYGEETKIVWDGDDDCQHEWKNEQIHETKLQCGNIEFQRNWREQASNSSLYSFCPKCNAWSGSLGLEPDPDLYIAHLIQIFDEIKRVLRKDGTLWVNIADTYGGANSRGSNNGRAGFGNEREGVFQRGQPKSLIGIPERFTLAMLQAGWIKRNTIIWHKRNCMPSSAKDRFTIDFEYIYFFTKSKKYYFEQQLIPYNEPLDKDYYVSSPKYRKSNKTEFSATNICKEGKPVSLNPKGRNKRCVWDITTKGIDLAHFASYPVKLAQECILPGCPPNGIVLDPFMGSGTTAIATLLLGRKYLGIELNANYVKMAKKRINNECGLLNFS